MGFPRGLGFRFLLFNKFILLHGGNHVIGSWCKCRQEVSSRYPAAALNPDTRKKDCLLRVSYPTRAVARESELSYRGTSVLRLQTQYLPVRAKEPSSGAGAGGVTCVAMYASDEHGLGVSATGIISYLSSLWLAAHHATFAHDLLS